MQATQALSYNFCNIFINATFFCKLHLDSWNEIRTAWSQQVSASVHWCLDFTLWIFFFLMDVLQYSFKGLAEGKMTVWLITALTTYKVILISLRVLLQGLLPLLSLYSICQNESANWLKSVKNQIIISEYGRSTYGYGCLTLLILRPHFLLLITLPHISS